MSSNRFPYLPEFKKTRTEEYLREVALRVNSIIRRGAINSTGEVTLDSGATSTTVNHVGVTADTVVLLMPASTNAAGVAYHITATLNSFTIHHALGITSADFRYAFFG